MQYSSPLGILHLFAWDGVLQRVLLPGESLTPQELAHLSEMEQDALPPSALEGQSPDTPRRSRPSTQAHCRVTTLPPSSFLPPTFWGTGPLESACLWLDDYFAGRRPAPWTGPLPTLGTPYQKRVWNALRAIPYGETRTYLQIAQAAATTGSRPCPRAAGQALNKNPLPILLPCHRVIASNGALTGFAAGIPMKERLLHYEKGG